MNKKEKCDYLEECSYPNYKRNWTFCRFGRYELCEEYQRLNDLKIKEDNLKIKLRLEKPNE